MLLGYQIKLHGKGTPMSKSCAWCSHGMGTAFMGWVATPRIPPCQLCWKSESNSSGKVYVSPTLTQGALSSMLEVVAMSVFVFSVLCYLTPLLALLSMQPVFAAQFVLDIYYTPSRCRPRRNHRNGHYKNLDHAERSLLDMSDEYRTGPELGVHKFNQRIRDCFGAILDNKIVKIVAFFLQVVGTGAIIATVLLAHKPDLDHHIPVIALPLSLVTLGALWSHRFQEFLLRAPQRNPETVCERDGAADSNARYKASEPESKVTPLRYYQTIFMCITTLSVAALQISSIRSTGSFCTPC